MNLLNVGKNSTNCTDSCKPHKSECKKRAFKTQLQSSTTFLLFSLSREIVCPVCPPSTGILHCYGLRTILGLKISHELQRRRILWSAWIRYQHQKKYWKALFLVLFSLKTKFPEHNKMVMLLPFLPLRWEVITTTFLGTEDLRLWSVHLMLSLHVQIPTCTPVCQLCNKYLIAE